MSFLRRANYAKGGPDGGNGGLGGSVYLVGDSSLNTLVDFRYTPNLKAENGKAGSSSHKKGTGGKEFEAPIPCGTTIFDEETLRVIGDVVSPGQRLLVAKGGQPGRGNASFKSSTNRAPRQTTKGEPGEQRVLRLQLRVLADVGLVGLPNAGKSTLVNAISAAKPKIAEYPFTTLHPTLGVVRPHSDQSFVIADVPGLVRGASRGVGLGLRFMRHLTRTSILLHLVELHPPDGSDPCTNLREVEEELKNYSEALFKTPKVTVLTKTDSVTDEVASNWVQKLKALQPGRPVFAISAVSNAGLDELVNFVSKLVVTAQEQAKNNPGMPGVLNSSEIEIAQDVLDHSLAERRSQSDNSELLSLERTETK